MIFTVFFNMIKNMHGALKKNSLRTILIIAISSLIICSTIFYFFESSVQPDLSYSDALWWGFVTCTTVGYGDYFPVTFAGRIISIILMLTGISTFGFITASIASIIIESKLKEGRGLMDIKVNNHFVIIGWDNKSEIILKELVQENPERNIVIVSDVERLDLKYKNCYFVHGDPTKDETLIRANIKNASTAIVVADEEIKNEGMADAKSVLICLAIDKINTNIHLIAEVLNEENIAHFKRANVDDIIVSSNISSRVMVRSALYKNVSYALKELLTNSYGNEIYESIVEEEYEGVSFKDLVNGYMNNNAIVLGIANGDVFINPDKDRKIKKNDIVIYISRENLD